MNTNLQLNTEGRRLDGQPIKGGETFVTASGRATLPYPNRRSERAASQWLIECATAEAKARQDDTLAAAFGAERLLPGGVLPPESTATMLAYLFSHNPPQPAPRPSSRENAATTPSSSPSPAALPATLQGVGAGWPFVELDVVYHIGKLRPSDKGQTHNALSHEGNGLSVTTEPTAWRQIAKLDGPIWALTPPKLEHRKARFVDRHALQPEQWNSVTTWAHACGYLKPVVLGILEFEDPESERVTRLNFDMGKAESRAEMELEAADLMAQGITATLQRVNGYSATASLNERTGFTVPLALAEDIALTAFAEEILLHTDGADGVWWTDELAPSAYSAPRGTVHRAALDSWGVGPERLARSASSREIMQPPPYTRPGNPQRFAISSSLGSAERLFWHGHAWSADVPTRLYSAANLERELARLRDSLPYDNTLQSVDVEELNVMLDVHRKVFNEGINAWGYVAIPREQRTSAAAVALLSWARDCAAQAVRDAGFPDFNGWTEWAKRLAPSHAAAPGQSATTFPELQRDHSGQKPASWVIKDLDSGAIIMETFEEKVVMALNRYRYQAVPIRDHLAGINAEIRAEEAAADRSVAPAPQHISPLGDGPHYRVWPDGTVQSSEDGEPYSWMSDDFLRVVADCQEDALAIAERAGQRDIGAESAGQILRNRA